MYKGVVTLLSQDEHSYSILRPNEYVFLPPLSRNDLVTHYSYAVSNPGCADYLISYSARTLEVFHKYNLLYCTMKLLIATISYL